MNKHLTFLPVIFIFLFACNHAAESSVENKMKIEKKETVSTDGISKTIADIGIEGMTCQAGCARNIQNKLSKMEGMISCEVSFEKKTAIVEFDDSKISENEMIETIQKIHGGQYSVTEVEVEKFIVQ